MEEQLDELLDPVLSFRRTARGPAQKLCQFDAGVQEFVLHWVRVISATNAEMAFQFADFFDQAYHCLEQDLQLVHDWIIKAMSAYDEKGLMAAIKILQAAQDYADELDRRRRGVSLEQQQRLLETFVCGLSGRDLKISAYDPQQHDFPYTDSETIYLPPICSDFNSKEENFLLYKAMVVSLWAQNWFGTFRIDWQQFVDTYGKQPQAIALYHSFEDIRILSFIKKELPGFYRKIKPLCRPLLELADDPRWRDIVCQLSLCQSAQSSYDLLPQYLGKLEPVVTRYQSRIIPDKVLAVMQKRIEKEKTLFKNMLGALIQEHKKEKGESELQEKSLETEVDIQISKDEEGNEITIDLFLDSEILPVPDNMHSLMESIIQDMGNLPPDYLQAAGPGAYRAKKAKQEKQSVWGGTYHEEDAFFYDEWDMLRNHYRKNWCVVREMGVTPVYDDFVKRTGEKYLGLIKSIRRTFEALRGEEKLLKKQAQGDDIDIDAVVEAYADLQTGMEMPERLFTRMQKEDRNIAVIFMVDMSGSTKGWINQAERESLILLAEALETLGDRYAIYGFSGIARKRCEIYRIKRFEDDYDDKVKARISGISARDYTRMGFAIRHLTALIDAVEARTKLLITLSDGKPEDYDGQYRGEYGIEDTRQALYEARQKGIHAFCITIDETAREYLPHMYGAANFVVIDDVARLPLKVSEIYRRITTR